MTSRYGLTPAQALPRILEAQRIADDQEQRTEILRILGEVRRLAYHAGSEEERCQGSWS